MDSNHRSQRQQIYSLPRLATSVSHRAKRVDTITKKKQMSTPF